ncbi:MAG TPA: hypothetical protein VNG89_19380 [Vicinamibacterales bacterium]|jgi:hypothetical protein|nr:hypothetical protein [Vicinamibacterales bacterium]
MTRRFLFAAALALAVGACGNDSTSGTVSTPTATRTTDTFSGTVQVGGSNFHSFPVSQAGTTDATLTAATPPAGVAMGFAIGTTGDGNCTPLAGASGTVVAGATPQITGLTTAGTLCVQIRDVGQATGPVSYTVTVTHP